MAMPNTPCYQCGKRNATCHSDCNEYSLYKLEMAEYNAVINDAKAKERAVRDYEIRQYSKRRVIKW